MPATIGPMGRRRIRSRTSRPSRPGCPRSLARRSPSFASTCWASTRTCAASPVTWTLTHVGPMTAACWPPPDTEPLRLFLVDAGRAHRGPEGGVLSTRPDHIPLEARWQHDPRDLVPSLEGEAIDGWFRRPDERITQVRDDVITFTSEPAREPLDLAGPVTAELALRTPDAGGHVMAKLCDVYPTGEARRIVDGACRVVGGSSVVVGRSRADRLPVAAGSSPPSRALVERIPDGTSGTRARRPTPGTPSGRRSSRQGS